MVVSMFIPVSFVVVNRFVSVSLYEFPYCILEWTCYNGGVGVRLTGAKCVGFFVNGEL
jgi:hypothetical protein